MKRGFQIILCNAQELRQLGSTDLGHPAFPSAMGKLLTWQYGLCVEGILLCVKG